MNNDICFEKNNMVFNYRIAAVIKNGDKLLVQKDSRSNLLALPGGRCELGESSDETCPREFLEETGIESYFVKSLGIIENFFTSSFEGKTYHEILIVNEIAFKDKDMYNNDIIKNIEEKKKDYLTYFWKSIEELTKEDFRPKIVLDIINNDHFTHIINKDK